MRGNSADPTSANLALARHDRGRPLASILMDQQAIAPHQAAQALGQSLRTRASIARVVEKEGLASADDVLRAQALHWGAMRVTRAETRPDPAVYDLLPVDLCLKEAVLPWVRIGDTLVLATARPERYEALLADLPPGIGPVMMAVTHEADIHAEIAEHFGADLARQAECYVPADQSCRDMNRLRPRTALFAGLCGVACLACLALAPLVFFGAILMVSVVTLILAQILKLGALIAALTERRLPPSSAEAVALPSVSVLVPLFQEHDIAAALVGRLDRLTYPKTHLDVVLVLEEDDPMTRAALASAALPPWMRVIEVPDGALRTKPRAMNYALRFCNSDIIGIYDAEDAPAPNQIERVVAHFARSPPEVACLQGILDFYNPHANWMSRCFAVEYASWFRILLPGMARLGFAVPLGGTTVFFRREVLEEVRGWDAHNVTEDADLGVRLARFGYRTELVATVTREEANNRVWPWIKQRSRWIKGYMMTWRVHMRQPWQLWRDLGAWRFVGFHLVFLTAILHALTAPVLWTFWAGLIGWHHPFLAADAADLTPTLLLLGLFLTAEGVSLVVGFAAISRSPHNGLMYWVPTMLLYFPLGMLAAYKAAWEVFRRPFFWDKTQHGKSLPDHAAADLPPDA